MEQRIPHKGCIIVVKDSKYHIIRGNRVIHIAAGTMVTPTHANFQRDIYHRFTSDEEAITDAKFFINKIP